MEKEQLSEHATGLVPDFFFELIARIVPGLVAILTCAYWSGGDFKAAYFNIGPLTFVLVAAWVVGVTLDLGVYRVAYAILTEGARKRVVPDLRPPMEFIRGLEVWDRRILFKQFALLVFLRGMMVMCAVTGVVCVVMWLWSGGLRYLPVLHEEYGWYGVVCSILACLFWLSWKKNWRVTILLKQSVRPVFLPGVMAICAVTAVVCVVVWLCSGWFRDLPVLYQHYGRYGVVCSILTWVFLVSWRAHRVELIEWCKAEEEAQKAKASKKS